MISKRDFLKSGATAIVASSGRAAPLAAVLPRLDGHSPLASWHAHVDRAFDVDGQAVTLQAATAVPGRQPGGQFSRHVAGQLQAAVGGAMHAVAWENGASVTLYPSRTPQGLRADFCRLSAAE